MMEANNYQKEYNDASGKQKVIFMIGALVLLSIVVVLVVMFIVNGFRWANNDEEIQDETYVDEQGYTVSVKTTTDEKGEAITTKTKEDSYGNVTTVDPDLITTYFPYQQMRKHNGWYPSLRFFVDISAEKENVLVATVEDCDVENDKELVRQYIDSIPLDMSAYSVEYQTFETDSDCGE